VEITSADQVDFQAELSYFRQDVVVLTAMFSGLIGFLALLWILRPNSAAAPVHYFSVVLFLLTISLSSSMAREHLHSATYILILGITGVVVGLSYTSETPILNYVLVLPVLLASVLLSQRAFLAMVLFIFVCVLLTGIRQIASTGPVDALFPLVIVAISAAAVWLSTRQLYLVLEMVWQGYSHALRNEQLAQERQAELRQTLKQLDEAIYTQQRLNYQLRWARDHADDARRLRQQFAQTISHELRTPLNLIVGFTELMTQSPAYYGAELPFNYLRDLGIVYQNAAHLKSLVDDILDMARIEAAQMTLVPQKTAIGPFVTETINTIRGLIEAKGLYLHLEIQQGLPQLWIDQTRIRQVFFNLLNNASRFTDEGGITVRIQQEDDNIVFSVADTGVGIAPENLYRIFEAFQQLETYQRGGTGLGLTITKRFIELHGGRVWVNSRVNEGSTFYFSLPAERMQDAEQTLSPLAAHTETRSRRPEERILLVVTESHTAVSMLTRYLFGCRAVLAHDLGEAYPLAQKLRPEAVVIDTVHNEVDSAELQALTDQWNTLDIPVIACPLPGLEPMRQELAVDGYLAKPLSREHLWTVLRQFGEHIDQVLIIDDNRDFVRLLSRMLDHPLRRYRVLSASNGQEGLELLALQQPDLIILDLEMPVMNGFQFLEQFKQMAQYQHVPIIVATGQDETDTFDLLQGTFSITRRGGLRSSEIVRLIQTAYDPISLPA
jgi:signal transduction histidine kinase/CheY-like chemotaxis protein